MTLTPDRLDDLDFEFDLVPEEMITAEITTPNLPERFNNALVLRAEEPPQATFSMQEWQESMDEMESSYRAYQVERWNQITQAPAEPPHLTADMIYDAVRELSEAPQRQRQRELEARRRATFADHYCYCSPGRGMFFERYGEAEFAAYRPPGVYADSRPGPRLVEPSLRDEDLMVTYHRWEPTPEPSKELVRIADDVDPLPDSEAMLASTGSLMPILVGVGVSVLVGFVSCVNLALAFMG